MKPPHRSDKALDQPHGRTRARLAATIAVGAVLSGLYACSLFVDNASQQCQSDADCVKIGGSTCDKTAHVCLGPGAGAGAGSSHGSTTSSGTTSPGCDHDGGIEGGGCYACDAGTDIELLNRCTDSSCIPFDNIARIDALADGGKLPAIP